MRLDLLVGFVLAVIPICLTPGASFALGTNRVIAGGRGEGLLVAAGTATGLFVHAGLAAIGLSALVMRSAEAFTAVRVAGAAYLVWLGISTLRGAVKGGAAPKRVPWHGHNSYVQGLLGNVLNPKAAAVYLTLVPQFLDPGNAVAEQIAILAAGHAAVAVGWLTVWTMTVSAARQTISSLRFKTTMNRITGTVMIALGLRSAVA